MDEKLTGDAFMRSLAQIIRREMPHIEKLPFLLDLLIHILKTSVKNTGIQFHNVFSIIAYAGHQYKLSGRLLYNIHRFRREASHSFSEQKATSEKSDKIYRLGIKVIADVLRLIYHTIPNPGILQEIPPDQIYLEREEKIVQFIKSVRVLIVSKDEHNHELTGLDMNNPGTRIIIRYNLPDRNELFNDSIKALDQIIRLPAEVNLIDVEIDEKGFYLPRAFILEPDFLIDITSVAECFKGKSINESGYFIKKFSPGESSKYLILGLIANFFLDELMANPDLSFRNLIERVFQINPLAFSLFDDRIARDIVSQAQKHYVHLKYVLSQEFPKKAIKIENCFLETTFYSESYGLQGRLDVFYQDPLERDKAAIIELKSSQPFNPNSFGLSHDHYIQTLLYDLLIKSASRDQIKPVNYILYSALQTDQLKFAPSVRSQQYEAMAARNQLIIVENQLAQCNRIIRDPERFSEFLRDKSRKTLGYTLEGMNAIISRFSQLDLLEKKYFLQMISLITREYHLAKTGNESDNRNNGQAALWLNSIQEKEEQFNILSEVQMESHSVASTDPIIVFLRTGSTNALANFRQGDLTLFYPASHKNEPLSGQLFKGTIIALDKERIKIRLRAKQFNDTIFEENQFWFIEHDNLDSSVNYLFRSMSLFSAYSKEQRSRFLGLVPPREPWQNEWKYRNELTEEQNRIMNKIINTDDYFLLWGPPGTGKTSVIVRHIMQHLIAHTEEQILLLAYTNRAVDEMCHALVSGGNNDFLRIGSRYSTAPDFIDNLLSIQSEKLTNREDFRELIHRHRIITGTISSVLGKTELFQLKKFDRLIIDEATQVLEPMAAGLLPMFRKILLIGDHRQLAAVVAQPAKDRVVMDKDLLSIGLRDTGSSYFERIFHRCENENWTWAFDRLNQQGRMHLDIMEFPGRHFYGNMLEILPGELGDRQKKNLEFTRIPADPLTRFLAVKRVMFIPVSTQELFSSKVNRAEAIQVAEILLKILELHQMNESDLSLRDLGIVTPFRAQIAQLRQEIHSVGLPADEITIDTVERFQGGAKRIIIISLCINSINQMENLVSLSTDQVDRKLNVALTRAREQVIMIGDPDILRQNPVYRNYIDTYNIPMQNSADHKTGLPQTG